MSQFSRRGFLQFMGAASGASLLSNCHSGQADAGLFSPLPAVQADQVQLVEGLHYQLLIAYGDPINRKGDSFGYDNDYIACLPTERADEAILWVNHESVKSFLMNGWDGKTLPRNPKDVADERRAVGGSFLKLKRGNDRWSVVMDDPMNRRVHADTDIPFKGGGPIMGATSAKGTLGNCAGGVTPWNTVLTCEENYYKFFGEVSFKDGKRDFHDYARHGWHHDDPRPPEHYGWVVEVDPKTGESSKLLGLGRFAHECATCVKASDGRVVVYTGDDRADECVYKFISDKPGSLESGTLYVADVKAGRWLPLDLEANPKLKEVFASKTEMLIRTREAAHIVGGSPLARPEDIEIHPENGDVYICLTNDDSKGNHHGHITKIREKDGDHLSMEFSYEVFLAGGKATGFSSPDNLVFDKQGNLWFSCDVSESKIGRMKYAFYGNNALFYVPLSGPGAGIPMRVANAPNDAEFTGPCFSPDGKQLFLSVQHPGARSKPGHYTSHWPDGGESKPRPGVIVIEGPLLNRLVGGGT